MDVAEDSDTDFAWLNWIAKDAGDVVDDVRKQWEIRPASFDITFIGNTSIKEIINHKPLRLSTEIGKGDIRHPANVVILCVGFGDEKRIDNVQDRPYWTDLVRPRFKTSGPYKWLVTGSGDGGLIDAISLVIKDFRHNRFTKEVIATFEDSIFKSTLLNIDQEAYHLKSSTTRYRHQRISPMNLYLDLNLKLPDNIKTYF